MKRTFSVLNGDVYEYEVNFKEEYTVVSVFFKDGLFGYGVIGESTVSIYNEDYKFLESHASGYEKLESFDESNFKGVAEEVVITLRSHRLKDLVEQMDVILNCANLHTDTL